MCADVRLNFFRRRISEKVTAINKGQKKSALPKISPPFNPVLFLSKDDELLNSWNIVAPTAHAPYASFSHHQVDKASNIYVRVGNSLVEENTYQKPGNDT